MSNRNYHGPRDQPRHDPSQTPKSSSHASYVASDLHGGQQDYDTVVYVSPLHHTESRSSRAHPADNRRLGMRFPIEMAVTYRVGAKSVEWLSGKTVNISSSGVLIRTDTRPVRGSKVQLALAWPKLLDDRIPLRLMVHGHVVRSVNGEVAISFKRFEFRTARELGRVEMAAAERS